MNIPRWSQPRKFNGVDLSSEKIQLTISINRGDMVLIWTHRHTCVAHMRERERETYQQGGG